MNCVTVKERRHVGQVLGHEFVAFSLESHIPDNNAPHGTDIFLQTCGKRWDLLRELAAKIAGEGCGYWSICGRFESYAGASDRGRNALNEAATLSSASRTTFELKRRSDMWPRRFMRRKTRSS